LRLNAGGFSERISWSKLNQETLKSLMANPKTAPFVEPYIEVPAEEKAKAKRQAIDVKPVPHPARPQGHISLFAALSTPMGLVILIVLVAANLYAGYEVALFRHHPFLLVCAVSLVLPVLGPIIFLASLPRVI